MPKFNGETDRRLSSATEQYVFMIEQAIDHYRDRIQRLEAVRECIVSAVELPVTEIDEEKLAAEIGKLSDAE